MPIPMLADFALRLSCGLGALLLLTSGRDVPPSFFRTQCLIVLGLLVLAALDLSRLGLRGPVLYSTVLAAFLSYLGAVGWGLGLPRVAGPIVVLIVLASGGALLGISHAQDPRIWGLNGAGRLASASLLGATFSAMLLGHHYLTAPAMSIEPLKRFVRGMAWALIARAVLAGAGLTFGMLSLSSSGFSETLSPLFLAVRWGMGILAPAVAIVLTWKTVQIRSTQSATGILYIAVTFVLFGELTAMVLSREARIIL
ncbi:MAG: hypothetical protein NVSMB9_01980 [Isosphaeraceae bacterium]